MLSVYILRLTENI